MERKSGLVNRDEAFFKLNTRLRCARLAKQALEEWKGLQAGARSARMRLCKTDTSQTRTARRLSITCSSRLLVSAHRDSRVHCQLQLHTNLDMELVGWPKMHAIYLAWEVARLGSQLRVTCPQQYAGAARQPRAAAEYRNVHHLHSGDGSPVIGTPGQRRDQFWASGEQSAAVLSARGIPEDSDALELRRMVNCAWCRVGAKRAGACCLAAVMR